MERVVAQAPGDAGAQARLAAARLAAGDTAGTVQAAQDALRLNPAQAGVREMLIVASLARGDITTAEAELGRLPPEARSTELATVAEATLRIARLDLAGGRAGLEDALRRFPESIGARLGLARVNARAGQAEEAQRLWAEVLQRDPSNVEALGAIAVTAVGGGPRAAAARAALEAAQAAAPSAPTPAITLANVLMRSGEAERALTLLDSEGLRSGPLQRGAALNLMRSEANSVLQRWPAAEAAARTAFADEPESPVTRRQLAVAMARNGDARGAEELIQAGLRRRPGDVMLQQTLVALVQQARGLDAALAAADELARQRDALPAAATLRGDLLLSAQRPADAARAYAAAYAADPSGPLALRAASAWQAAGDAAQAASALETWLQRSPRDAAALSLLAQFDLQAGRNEAAERRLATVVEQAPTDAVALNNLAWALALRGGAENLARARTLAERSYFLLPTPESADTLGWALVRSGEPQRGLPLLREAVAARRVGNPAQGGGEAAGTTDPGMVYRLAFALNATGDRAEALRVLEPVMANAAAFPERAEAEQLLTTLRRGR
jgi:tetratricopeptide (TPR) repeat protein